MMPKVSTLPTSPWQITRNWKTKFVEIIVEMSHGRENASNSNYCQGNESFHMKR